MPRRFAKTVMSQHGHHGAGSSSWGQEALMRGGQTTVTLTNSQSVRVCSVLGRCICLFGGCVFAVAKSEEQYLLFRKRREKNETKRGKFNQFLKITVAIFYINSSSRVIYIRFRFIHNIRFICNFFFYLFKASNVRLHSCSC